MEGLFFVDPNVAGMIENRIVYSLRNRELFAKHGMDIPTKYVVFGDPDSQKLDGVILALNKHSVSHRVVELDETTSKILDGSDVDVLVLTSGHLFFSLKISLAPKTIVIVLNDYPPGDRHNFHGRFEDEFDYIVSYACPNREARKKLFEQEFESFAGNTKVNLDKEAFEYLAECSNYNYTKDIKKYCQTLKRRVLFDKDDKININLKRLKEEWLYQDHASGGQTIEYQTARKKRKRDTYYQYHDDDGNDRMYQ
jgi:hypothetical protein